MNLQNKLDQLHIDIDTAIKNGTVRDMEEHLMEKGLDWEDKVSIQSIPLEKWCGIKKEQLPLEISLTNFQLTKLLAQLKRLLKAHHVSIVFQLLVPENVQYRIIRARFDQILVYQQDINKFYFSLCAEPETKTNCLLEEKYCHCKFYDNFFKRFSSQEEYHKPLDISLNSDKVYLLKKRFGPHWYEYLRIDDEDLELDA